MGEGDQATQCLDFCAIFSTSLRRLSGKHFTYFGPMSVAFEGDIIINSVYISLFHVAFTKLLGFYLCF